MLDPIHDECGIAAVYRLDGGSSSESEPILGGDENVVLAPVREMTPGRAVRVVRVGEMVEATPASIRLRKTALRANLREDRLRRKSA